MSTFSASSREDSAIERFSRENTNWIWELRRCLPHYYAFYISAACLENDLMNKNSEPHKDDNLAWNHDKANPMLCQFPNHILSSVNFDSILLSYSNQTQTLFIPVLLAKTLSSFKRLMGITLLLLFFVISPIALWVKVSLTFQRVNEIHGQLVPCQLPSKRAMQVVVFHCFLAYLCFVQRSHRLPVKRQIDKRQRNSLKL